MVKKMTPGSKKLRDLSTASQESGSLIYLYLFGCIHKKSMEKQKKDIAVLWGEL